MARRTARRHLPKVAAAISAVALAMILVPVYINPTFWWITETSTMVREVAGWAVIASLVVLPAIAVTTGLAIHFAASASPPVRSWAVTWAAAVAAMFGSLFFAFAAAVIIIGE